ncbi:MAG TPA: TIGR03118 family protein [Acidobacteriaceae bacterium]|jgi:uncharacterized protein (TIGR03118 family)|nr:TIGR03118 family protein [Acidobacteriaceae bacterium]
MDRTFLRLSTRACGALVAAACALPALAQHYQQTNLVADQSGAAVTDTNLVNPWGLSRSSTSPWWASDNGTGLSTLYGGTGTPASLVVTIPPADPNSSSTGTPTGTVFNGGTGFTIASGKPALFLFVTEDGTVSGWNPGANATSAVIEVNTKSASVFKGAALATVNLPHGYSATFLYAADFRKGRIQVYDSSFHHVQLMEDMFRDQRIPQGFAPFNIQNIGGNLYVTFAKQDDQKHDEVDGAGLGYVDVFSPLGFLLRRLDHGWWLNAPWAVAIAPGDFGIYSHDLLVGNFGSGQIDVFDPATGAFKGVLNDASNHAIAIDGLWGLSFGSGGTSGSATALYFSAGSDGEQHGLFGTITPVENTLGNSQ